MKKIFFSHFFSVFISLMFLLPIISFAAIDSDKNSTTKKEDNSRYVYLGNELSNIVQVVKQVSALDEDQDSILHAMKKYIDNGHFVAGYDEVMEALTYAQELIERSTHRSNTKTNKKWLRVQISEIIKQITDGSLSVNSETLEHMPEQQEMTTRAHAFVINKNLRVHGQSWFDEHIRTYQGIHVSGHLKVSKNSKFKKNLRVKGTLSAADAIIGTLSVTDLVVASCVDDLCVENLSVNDLVVASCMDNLCVENLSAVDVSVSGTLSANDVFIENATIQNLIVASTILDSVVGELTVTGTASINDAIINNATITSLSATDAVITDLTVTNCMTSLCVNSLSVVDASISGTLSLNDVLVDDLTITSLSATDAVITDLTVTNCMTSLCVNSLSVVDASISGTLSVNDEIINGSLQIPALTPAGVVHNSALGLLSSSLIVNADVDPAAAIVDTKLATISTAGKVANSATTATSLNTPNTIVLRDGTGSFAAQVVSLVDAVATGNLVFTGATSTSTTGNITKGGSSFIHNFGTDNTFVGINSGNFTMVDIGSNTAVGVNTLSSNTSGNFNTALGGDALAGNTTGDTNTAVGHAAMASNTTGVNNTAVGNTALGGNTAGVSNVAVGADAMVSNTTGDFNVAVGVVALSSNTTGIQNTAVGNSALQSSTIAIQNVAVGANALINNITGNNNVALGRNALANANSNSNIGIGSSTGITLTTGTGNIYIDADASVATESDTTRIGASQTSCFIAGIRGATTGIADAIAVLIDSAGQLGTISSSQNVKHDIEDMGDVSNNILDLRPVTFVYNGDESNTRQYGLIAEEVDQIFTDIVVKDQEGQPVTVQYHVLPVLLLNEVKKQHIINNRQDEELRNLTITIEAMKIAIDTLQLQLQSFINKTNLEHVA